MFHHVVEESSIKCIQMTTHISSRYITKNTPLKSIPPHFFSFRAIEETATVHDKPVEEVLITDCGVVSKPDSL
jgi:hypothetical protein